MERSLLTRKTTESVWPCTVFGEVYFGGTIPLQTRFTWGFLNFLFHKVPTRQLDKRRNYLIIRTGSRSIHCLQRYYQALKRIFSFSCAYGTFFLKANIKSDTKCLFVWARLCPSWLRMAHFSREFREHAPPGKFLRLKFLRCNLVHSGRLNLANAWIPYWTCNAEIFNKPQKGAGPPRPTPKSALAIESQGHFQNAPISLFTFYMVDYPPWR